MSEMKRSVDYENMFGNLTVAAIGEAKSGRLFRKTLVLWKKMFWWNFLLIIDIEIK